MTKSVAAPPSVDTPVPVPATRLDAIKSFIGDLARPMAIIMVGFSTAWAGIVIAYRVSDGNDGAFLMGALLGGLAVIYGAKSVENYKVAQTSSEAPKG